MIDILQARLRIRTRILRTPLRRSEWLSAIAGCDVFLKLESLQPTGSFKIRGALNAAVSHVERHGAAAPPIVTASAGNHGRALAYAAESLRLRLTVYVPRDAPRAKQDAIARHGADLKPVADYDEAERAAKRHAASGEAIYISPYANADVIAGAGTIAVEIFEDLPEVAAIAVPIGGGGLAGGIGLVACAAEPRPEAPSPRPQIIGVEAAASTAFTSSLAAGRITAITPGPTLADGLAGNLDAGSITFELVRDTVRRVVTVTEDELAGAMRGLAAHDHLIAEGAGAAAVAAIQAGKCDADRGPIVAILSGANVDLDRLVQVLSRG
ncbi:MAG: threonine ammonia-lyase [Vicinamibacterales bacterium]